MALGTPTLSLTAQLLTSGGFPRVELSLNCTDMTEGTIYRSTSEGLLPVRGLEAAPATGELLYGVDYEIPQGQTLNYMAIATDGIGEVSVSSTPIGGLDRGGDFLWPVGQPTGAMEVYVEEAPNLDYEITQGVEYVIDRVDPVVVSGSRHSAKGEIRFITLTDAARVQFQQMVFAGRVLVFSPRIGYGFDELLYLAVGKVSEERVVRFGYEPARRWVCDVQRVAVPPANFYVAAGNTWQYIVDQNLPWLIYAQSGQDWQEFAGV